MMWGARDWWGAIRRFILALTVVVLSLSAFGQTPDGDITRLIEQLCADDFSVSQAAAKRLVEIGLPAVDRLEAL